MPIDIDPETINADSLPGIWSPVQWETSEEEQVIELEQSAIASLLWIVDVPETILRLLLDENGIEQTYKAPKGYDPSVQGEWEDNLVTFTFKRKIELIKSERSHDYLYLEYKVEDFGTWIFEIETDKVSIHRK